MNARIQTHIPRHALRTFHPIPPLTTPFKSLTCIYSYQLTPQPRRHINRLAKHTGSGPPSVRIATDPTLDERIGSPNTPAHLVDATGSLLPAQPLAALLDQLHRPTEHLRRVGEADDGTPVCKVVSEEQLIAQFRAADVAASARRADLGEAAAKQVELTWAITPNDLGYRLRRMQGFLREGRRVEVLIAPKRKGRRAEVEEARAVLDGVRGAAAEVEGAEEWKAMVGELGKQVELYFAGKGVSGQEAREKEVSKTEERMKRKEAEERERRAKEEKRMKRRAEERKQREKLAASL